MRKTKLDVLLVTAGYPPRVAGGVATHVEYLAKSLASIKRRRRPDIWPYFIHVLTLGTTGIETVHPNLLIHRCEPDANGTFQEADGVPLAGALRYWRRQWFTHGRHPDVIHAHDYHSLLVGALLKRAFSVPLLLSIHRSPKWPDDKAPQWNEKECYLSLFYDAHFQSSPSPPDPPQYFPVVDYIISPSRHCFDGLAASKISANRSRRIPHGVPIDALRGIHDSEDALGGLQAQSGSRIILCPARIDKHKGLIEFVDAAVILNREFNDLHFVVCGGTASGDGAHFQELLDRVASKGVRNIQFGHIDGANRRDFRPDEMPTLYRRAEICVLPSHTENYPIAILEAQAFGCPVVATAVGGIPEIITNGQTGLLFEREKTEELAERVGMLLVNRKYRRDLILGASAWLAEHGDAAPMASAYTNLYRELTGIWLRLK